MTQPTPNAPNSISTETAQRIAGGIFDKIKDLSAADRKLVFSTLGPKLNPDFHANVAKLNEAKARIDATKNKLGKKG